MTTPVASQAPGAPAGDAAPAGSTTSTTITAPSTGQAPATGTAASAANGAAGTDVASLAQRAAASGDPNAGGTGTGAPQGQPAGTDPAGDTDGDGEPSGDDVRLTDLPPRWQKYIKDARRGEEAKRLAAKEATDKAGSLEKQLADTQAKQQQILDGVAKLFGLTEGEDTDEAPDPEKLTAQLAEAQTRHRETQVELAVYRAAGVAGADPDALLDSRSFLNAVLGLDPTDAAFAAAVTEAIKSAVETNPKLKAAAPAPVQPQTPSGGQFAGGSGGRTDPESLSVEDFRQRRRDRGARAS